jgi:hypothetical protein
MGVDVSVSEWSLQADPARSRNASAMPLSSFFTIECYDSMRQRNQIYLERRTRPPANSKRAKAYAHKMRRSMNEHDVVHVKETVRATPNFEDTPVEIKAGWCGTIIAHADKPMPCVEFNEDYGASNSWWTWTLQIRKWSGNRNEQNHLHQAANYRKRACRTNRDFTV